MKAQEYVQDHGLLFCLLFLGLLLQTIIMVCLGIPFGLLMILDGLWLMLLVVLFATDFLRKQQHFAKMHKIAMELDQKYVLHEVLPKAANHEEAFYHWLLYVGNKAMLEEISRTRRERHQYQEYVEQWVHEIKTPIAALKLWGENQSGEEKRKALRQVERIEHYVEQALFYARSENVEKDFRIQQISLAACVQEALLQCKYLCTQAHMQIHLDICECQLYSDEKWLIFILNQLIENAVKYRQPGQPSLAITTRCENDSIQLCLQDNGIGISAQDLPRVWEKGFTGENGRTSQSHATGIGLYLVQKLCTAIQIKVSIQSVKGKGTCVQLTLPKG